MKQIKAIIKFLGLVKPTNIRHGILRTYSSERPKPFESIPGPSSIPVLGSFHHFLPVIVFCSILITATGSIGIKSNFTEAFGALGEKYGPMVKLEGVFARGTMLLLFEPELYEKVFRAEETNPLRPGFETLTYYREKLRKSTFNGVFGLTTAQGEDWRRFRTKVNPVLLKIKFVKLYAPALEEIADEMVDRLIRLEKEGDYLKENWENEMTKWSLESVALVGLGTRLGCLKDDLDDGHPGKQLIKCAKDIVTLSFKLELFASFWKMFPTPNFKKLVRTFDLQWELSSKYIAQPQKRINERGHDVPEEDKSMIERLLAVDQTVAIMMANEMLLAGIDTVSFTVTTLLYYLATNPEKQEKARQDILSNEPNKHYLRACLKESMRLLPIVSANLRRTSKDHIVAGYHVPEGSSMEGHNKLSYTFTPCSRKHASRGRVMLRRQDHAAGASARGKVFTKTDGALARFREVDVFTIEIDVIAPNEYLSKQDKFYPRAKEYIPERWLADKSDPLYYGNTHPMVTSPFGFGIRSCIGQRIAMLEMETLVKKLLPRVRVSWEGPPLKITSKVMNTLVKPFSFKFEALK